MNRKGAHFIPPSGRREDELIHAIAARYAQSDTEALRLILAALHMAETVLGVRDAHFARLGISQSRFALLMHLATHEGDSATPSELAELWGVTRSAVTSLLDGLEKSGLVERTAHQSDRRALSVRLTPQGSEFLDAIYAHNRAWEDQLLQGISDDEKKRLAACAQALTELFERPVVAAKDAATNAPSETLAIKP
ncbi:MAG TPA: MarR family transcriptional regulator [Abditibacterium sp.]|jgi:DNA-binding MarR family transcriptional regulator